MRGRPVRNEFPAHSAPAIAAMEAAGLRTLPEQDRAQAVNAATRAVLALLCAEPGISVTLDAAADAITGELAFTVSAAAADEGTAHELATALHAALAPLMELVPAMSPTWVACRGPRWRLHPAAGGVAPMGLTAPPPRAHTLAWDGASAGFEDVAAELLRHPGSGLSVTLAPGPALADRSQTIAVAASAITSTGRLPIGLRAVLDRWALGHRFSRNLSHEGTPLLLALHDAAARQFLPSAGPSPVPGFRTAGPAPLPVQRLAGAACAVEGLPAAQAALPTGTPVTVRLGTGERLQHIHVTGKTGTGKSTLLAALAHHAAAAGEGMLLLDPHGHLAERVAAELPGAAAARTLLIRAGDLENPVPVNTLAAEDPDQLELAIADLAEAFYNLYDPGRTGIIGPRFEQILGMCLRTLAALHGPRASFLDVPRLLTDAAFQRQAIAAVTDPRVRAWWANDARARSSNDYGEVVAWVCSKWERFIGTRAVRGALCSGLDALDPAHVMDNGTIVLLDLSKGQIGEPAARLLGFLYLTRFWQAAPRRTTRRPFTVMVDEAQSFLAGTLPAMLSEGRKFGLSVVLAHQYLAQLPHALGEALEGNTATAFAFRSGERDASLLASRMGHGLTPSAFTHLPDLDALCQRTAGPVSAAPHTVRITHNNHPHPPTHSSRLDTLALRTQEHLSTPHRTVIAQALATGAALPPDPPAPPAVRRPAPRPAPWAGKGRADEPAPSAFLQEWLAKHQAKAPAHPQPDEAAT